MLVELRNKGGFECNTNPEYSQHYFQTARRRNPENLTDGERYKVCFKCRGFFIDTNIRHHVRKCSQHALAGERAVLRLSRLVERRVHPTASDMLVDRIAKMRDNAVSQLVSFDWLLITFGNKISKKFKDHYQHKIVRQKLRLAARILNEMKSTCADVSDFASIYQPKNFDQVVDAIRTVGRFDPSNDDYGSPSTSADAVTLVREICRILIAQYIRQNNVEAQKIAENFLTLMNTEISDAVNKPVINAKAKMHREKEERIPTTADVKLFFKYIENQRKLYLSELKKDYSFPVWRKLLELTMASLIVFNKRRVGEIQNMVVQDFYRRKTLQEMSGDLFDNLSDVDKQIANRYSRVIIRGKLGNPVPVLFKPTVEQSLTLILNHRIEAGVPEWNNCLFALPSKIVNDIRVVAAGVVLRMLSSRCGAKDPESLRGTKIRKHMASVAITLELGDGEISELSDYLGHSEPVHRKNYRINPIERQVVKMSQLLEAATGECDEDESMDTCTVECEKDMNRTVPRTTSSVSSNQNAAPQQNKKVATSTTRKRNHVDSAIDCEVKTKKRWSEEEKSDVYEAFSSYIQNETLPSISFIESVKKKYKSLQDRSPRQIKAWMSNQKKPKKTSTM